MRISYVHGPGDAFGTFLQWQKGFSDTTIIKQTYSGQFYDIISERDGTGQVICVDHTESVSDKRFNFVTVKRNRGNGIRHYVNEIQYARQVGARIKEFSPDVVIIATDFPSYAFDALPHQPKKILSMHNTFWQPYGRPNGTKEKLINIARRISLRSTNHAVCVSLECQRQFEQVRSGRSFSIVQMPRLPEKFSDKSNTQARKMLFSGRVEINKGILDLIRAFNNVLGKLPYLELKIVGDGGAMDQCVALVNKLDLNSVIEFTGRLDAIGVGKAYAEADLCIVPTQWSFNEGLATVPIEAASYGVPSVISEAVPAKEQFGENVVTFEPENVEDLSQAIMKVVSNDEYFLSLKENARKSYLDAMNNFGDWKAGVSLCLDDINL